MKKKEEKEKGKHEVREEIRKMENMKKKERNVKD